MINRETTKTGTAYDELVQARKRALDNFGQIEHRLEFVDHINGVDFINDSKATDVNSTWYSLECMEQPVIWILGVADDEEDYALFAEITMDKVKGIVLLGGTSLEVEKELGGRVPELHRATGIEEAVAISTSLGEEGDVVLFSPACSGFDLFQNYKDRGEQFRKAVRCLRE